MSYKRAELKRKAREEEKSEKVLKVTQAQLNRMVIMMASEMLRKHEVRSAEKVIKIYAVAISIALQKQGFGARGKRMQRFYDDVDEMMNKLSHLIDRGKDEEILDFCDQLGIDAEDAFRLKRECKDIMEGDELEIYIE